MRIAALDDPAADEEALSQPIREAIDIYMAQYAFGRREKMDSDSRVRIA